MAPKGLPEKPMGPVGDIFGAPEAPQDRLKTASKGAGRKTIALLGVPWRRRALRDSTVSGKVGEKGPLRSQKWVKNQRKKTRDDKTRCHVKTRRDDETRFPAQRFVQKFSVFFSTQRRVGNLTPGRRDVIIMKRDKESSAPCVKDGNRR